MKKGGIFLILIILILSTLAYAASQRLEEGESKVIEGKTITVQSINQDILVIDVDGVNGFIENDSKKVINGAEITIEEIFLGFNPDFVDISVKILATCGDNICDLEYEDNSICCTDCGCTNNETNICLDNQCVKKELNECLSNTECDDKNKTSLDSCEGLPRKCVNKPYTCDVNGTNTCDDKDSNTKDECIDGICSFTPYEDLATCSTEEDCNDDDDCTEDICEGRPKSCTYKPIANCVEEEIEEVTEESSEKRGFFGTIWFVIKKIFAF